MYDYTESIKTVVVVVVVIVVASVCQTLLVHSMIYYQRRL